MSLNVAGKGFAQGNLTVFLDTLAVTSWSPAGRTISAAGMSTFTISGKGFDPAHCSRNWVWVNGVRCFVLGCTKSTITALFPGEHATFCSAATVCAYPCLAAALTSLSRWVCVYSYCGNGGHGMLAGGVANGSAAVEVWVESDDGSFDPSTSKKLATWNVNVTDPGAGLPRVAALLSSPALPVEGGTVRIRVEGVTTNSSKRWSIRLLPAFNLGSLDYADVEQTSRVNASLAGGIACRNLVVEAADVVQCNPAGVVPPGKYLVAVTVSGTTYILLPNMTEPPGSPSRGDLQSWFGLFSVSPRQGSIGGGTMLTLSGQGLSALQPSTSVVVIKVRVRRA